MPDRFDLVLRGGTVVSPSSMFPADVGVVGGTVAAVGALSTSMAAEVVDITGLHVVPGAIDTQVHFREPGLEHKEDLESGTRAAVAGGVTTVFEMPNTDPLTVTPEALQDKLNRAKGRAWCGHAFFVGATGSNLSDLAELEKLPGSPGIKVFMGSSTGPLLVEGDDGLRQVLQNGRRPVAVHAEDEPRLRHLKATLSPTHAREHPSVRDAEAARLATARLIQLCAETGRPVHILHISTADELELLRNAKLMGLPVTCEVTPQHILLGEEDYERLGSFVQMNPPVRGGHHRAAILDAVQKGLFDVFGSDHAPHTREEKAQPYPKSPSGMPGVQTLVPLVFDLAAKGVISVTGAVRMLSQRPAELYGLARQGRVDQGFAADLAVFDFSADFEVTESWLQSKCGWSPFVGRRLKARLIHTLVGGRFAVRDGALAEPGLGTPSRFTWKPDAL